MSFNLADLRKARTSDFASISAALKKTNEGGGNDDAGFFKLERDKAGNGSAVIRFLPKHPDDDLPWVSIYSHGFQGPSGRWYIENSLTTLGEQDPVAEANRALWATGNEADKKTAQARKRKLNYISNVLVVACPANPALVGKVLRFKYGKKIFEKLMDRANPTFEDDKPANPFDPFDGCNFKLRCRQVDGYPNYDTSTFEDPTPLASDDSAMLEILNQIKPLKEFISPSKFKSYDELKKKFDQVINGTAVSTANAEQVAERMAKEASAPPKSAGRVVDAPTPAKSVAADDGEDDIEAYFKSLSTD